MKDLILSWIEVASRGDLKIETHTLTQEECKVVVVVLQAIMAEASFNNLI
jgi:hypothetical protein